jgi:hypothetical protein
MNKAEYLQWCKNRALGYLDKGDVKNALASMMSDLRKSKKTEDHLGIIHGLHLALGSEPPTIEEARKFIEGFS